MGPGQLLMRKALVSPGDSPGPGQEEPYSKPRAPASRKQCSAGPTFTRHLLHAGLWAHTRLSSSPTTRKGALPHG